MTRRNPLPQRLIGRPFRTRDARGCGISAGRLRAHDLRAPFHGTRTTTTAAAETLEDRARAASLLLRGDQVLSHGTAAELIGAPLPQRLRGGAVHVTTIATDQAIRVRGTVGHRSVRSRARRAGFRGMPILHPADLFVKLGATLTLDELIILGDALVGWLRWCTLDELRSAARRHVGARGMRTVRAALDEIRQGSRSPGETRTRLVFTRNGLPDPELNFTVRDGEGGWVACVDLAYPEARIAVEYESDLHRTDARTFRKDLTRGEKLKDVGWWLVRVTAWDLRDGEVALVRRMRRLLHHGPLPAGPEDA